MAKRDGPWVRFYASDWLAGTRGMTASETGVYITLIATMYERAEPIARDDARLARLCGLPTRNFIQILDRLIDEEKITLVEGAKLWGRKVELEVRNRSARAEKSAMAARTKHQQNQRPVSARADAKQTPSSSQTVPRARVSEPDSEKESETNVSPKKVARGTRLPTDWEIPNDWGRWAVDEFGVSPGAVRAEAAKFKDYWVAKAGAQATKLDWLATWRNWCRNAFTKAPAQPRTSRPQTAADLLNEMMEGTENVESERATTSAQQYALPGPRGR